MRIFHTILLLLASISMYGQISINEYSASNLVGFPDNYGNHEDWIELYNNSTAPVDLSGWYLSDKSSKPTKWQIPNGTTIGAKGFLVFWCSGRDAATGTDFHTNFKLSQTKGTDQVVLSNASGVIVESFSLELTLVEHARCRTTDGGSQWVVCTNPSPNASNNTTNRFVRYTKAPSMSLSAGFYAASQKLRLVNNEPNSVLRFTIDGTNPTTNSPLYTDTIQLSKTTVVKAQAFSLDSTVLTGKMEFNTYFINENFTLAVFSVAADQVKDLANGDGDLRPIGSIEYFGTNKQRQAVSFGSLNRHGQDSWVLPHRSIDWISRDEMGYSNAVNAKLFNYSDRDEYQRFMFRASGDDNYPAVNDVQHSGSTHLRDEYVQLLAHLGDMKLDLRAVERCIVFLNGQYWGVYGLRERPDDHDFTDFYYNQDKYNIQYLTTWASTEAEYGGQKAFDDWGVFRDFILNNDMSDSTNYQIVKDNLQVTSLCDYMIANLNTVASDWLNYNTGWWRGLKPDGDHKKWGYILWDNDATFDYYINYSGVPNTSTTAQACDIDEISAFMDDFFGNGTGGGDPVYADPTNCPTVLNNSCPYPPSDSILMQVIASDDYCCDTDWDDVCQTAYTQLANGGTTGGVGDVGKHEKIFLKLQEENQEFRQLYYSRQADLQNTVYSCANMLSKLDSMVAVIKPEMPRQIQRWGGSMAEWQANVAKLRSFVEQRCTLIDDGMVDCFNLTGPFPLTLEVYPPGSGDIELNTLNLTTFPWSGQYFGAMQNLLDADKNTTNLDFHHWESKSGKTVIANPFSDKISIKLTEGDTLIAYFGDFVASNQATAAEYGLFAAPNPSHGPLSVRYTLPDNVQAHQVALYDVHGRVLWSQQYAQSYGQQVKTLDLNALHCAAGLYILEVRSEHGVQVAKVQFID